MRLATLAWRGLTARPLRTALTIIGVALGTTLGKQRERPLRQVVRAERMLEP